VLVYPGGDLDAFRLSLLKTLWSMQSLTFSRSGSGSPHRCFTCCTPYSQPSDRA
jgi:hypothetical protein